MSVLVSFGTLAPTLSMHAPAVGSVRACEVLDIDGVAVTEAAALAGEVAIVANGEADPIVVAFGADPDATAPPVVGVPAGAVVTLAVRAGDHVAVAELPDVPGAIADLAASAVDHESVELAFTPAADATFHQFAVSLADADEWSEPATLGEGGVVAGLEPETAYDFRVRGVNGFRFGPWSTEDDAVTET